MDWRQRFRMWMREKTLSQEKLACKMGITQGAIGHWLRGDRKIDLITFLALCAAAGADPKKVLFGEDKTLSTIRNILDTQNPHQLGPEAPSTALVVPPGGSSKVQSRSRARQQSKTRH